MAISATSAWTPCLISVDPSVLEMALVKEYESDEVVVANLEVRTRTRKAETPRCDTLPHSASDRGSDKVQVTR